MKTTRRSELVIQLVPGVWYRGHCRTCGWTGEQTSREQAEKDAERHSRAGCGNIRGSDGHA
jgi:hypothetical protein